MVELSYCVTNTNGRDFLIECLEAIRRTHPAEVEHEILVVDNASDDGSADAVRERFPEARVIARERREGLAENNSVLLGEARGEFCLLLNEDSELERNAPALLLDALRADPVAGAAGALLLSPSRAPLACAWRFPSLGTALAQALSLHRLLVTQSGGEELRTVGWVQSAAMLVRRAAAEEVGFLDLEFFVYSEEVDFQKRMTDAGWRMLHVPAARAVHHEQLATDSAAGSRRIVQFHRGRDLYMRKHHSWPVVRLARLLWAWSYVPRALAAYLLPDQSPSRYWLHARQALRPTRGEGMQEAAAAYNARLEREAQAPPRSSSRAITS